MPTLPTLADYARSWDMAAATLADEIVSALQRRSPDYDIWITKLSGRGYIWSGRKKGAELVRQHPIASWPGHSCVPGVRVCGTIGIVPGGGGAIRASGRRGWPVWAG